ncbi:hypothetical protein BDFB_015128 [Asbolus verrucosus]|uniref:DUF4817 domain-containing protein n=1 Tax=Asbolus verrucosus TaxID=1661398 RepID=A0A482W281_ASBVE|nr:hypothetical protein BDFB_015128 [Asbolus verrucosus]
MAFTEDHKKFMLEAYFRTGTKNDGVWQYSIGAYYEEFREEFPQEVFNYEQFRQTLHRSIERKKVAADLNCVHQRWSKMFKTSSVLHHELQFVNWHNRLVSRLELVTRY